MTRDYKYKNVVSKNGIYTLHINAELNGRISSYCKMKNLNKSKYLNDCINKAVREDEMQFLQELPKDELIRIIMNQKGE